MMKLHMCVLLCNLCTSSAVRTDGVDLSTKEPEFFKLSSSHIRVDHHPSITSHGDVTGDKIDRVESELVGENLWSMHDDSNLERFANHPGLAFTSAEQILPEVDVSLPETVKHEVYVNVPIGGFGDQAKIFAPGLNQFWMILSESNELLWYAIVSSAADGSPQTVFKGRAENEMYVSTLAFKFDDFSDKDNVVNYKVQRDHDGHPVLYIQVWHKELTTGMTYPPGPTDAKYLDLICQFEAASEDFQNSWLNPPSSLGGVLSASFAKERLKFFVKALQIYDLCHCYHVLHASVGSCIQGGNTDSQSGDYALYTQKLEKLGHQATSLGVKVIGNMLKLDESNWVKSPLVFWKDDASKGERCWHLAEMQKAKFPTDQELTGMLDSDFTKK